MISGVVRLCLALAACALTALGGFLRNDSRPGEADEMMARALREGLLDDVELDDRHVEMDGQGRRKLATHFPFSPAELESKLVCERKPWDEAMVLDGWCGPKYPMKYKPCPDCFIDTWCSTRAPWFGITCNGGQMTGRVITIDFEAKGIGGQIYGLMPFFTAIRNINLKSNQLTGPIPGNIGGCPALTYLQLHINGLSGAIPAGLGGARALTYLNVANNELSGAVPAALGNLVNLRYAYFQHNTISGALPSSLGNWRHLTYGSFTANQLSGKVPASFCKYQATTVIMVDHNPGLECYPQCLAKYSHFTRDNDPQSLATDRKVLCCCSGCSYVEVTNWEREMCPPTWPTAKPTERPPNWGPILEPPLPKKEAEE